MHIIIVGGGKVGFTLASQLQHEGHDITVIDRSEQVVTHINNTLDVIGCVGNGALYPVLRSAGVESCELLVAVTATDEVNMLCCLAAHKLGAKHTIARVRNPEYAGQLYALKDDLGLSMSINPERAVAEEIARILRFPSATQVELFARGKVELVSCKVVSGNALDHLKLCDLPRVMGAKVLICVVDRKGHVAIPSGNFILNPGDNLYLTGTPNEIKKFFKKAALYANGVRSVMIAGGSRIAFYLAEMLTSEGVDVKIVELSRERAEELAALLPKATVLCGNVADHELLDEERVDDQDAFVSLTGFDEGNILAALYAHSKHVHTVIAKVNNENLSALVRDSGLQMFISPKLITANLILCYVRALAARTPESNVLSLYKLVDGRAEVLEFRASESDAALLDKPLMDLNIKKDTLIAAIVHENRAVVPGGADRIFLGDVVLVATAAKQFNTLSDILEP